MSERDGSGRFNKGQSGNPNGRPRKLHVPTSIVSEGGGSDASLPTHLQRGPRYDPIDKLRPGAYANMHNIARQFITAFLPKLTYRQELRLRLDLANAMEAAACGKLTWEEGHDLPKTQDHGFIPWGWRCEWDRANSDNPSVRTAYLAELSSRPERATATTAELRTHDLTARTAADFVGIDREGSL